MQNLYNVFSILLLITLIKYSCGFRMNSEMGGTSLTMFKDMEGECNTYCFGLVKPILQQSKQNQFVELQDKIKELQEIIKSTENQLKDVQIKLGVCEDATQNRETLTKEQINRKSMQLTELQQKTDEQDTGMRQMERDLISLKSRIGICEEAVSNREIQYKQLLDLNVACNNSSKIKDDLLATSKALVERHKSAAGSDVIKFELKERQLKDLNSQLMNKESIIVEHKSKLNTLLATNRQQADEISQYKAQLAECESSSCYGKTTDIHIIRVPGAEPFAVFCDSALADAGWTVIQRRRDGSVVFNRNWTDYRLGFGDLRGEFFIGLQKLHLITQSQHHELYIFLQGFDEDIRYARYDHFQIDNERESYKLLSLGQYQGTAGDALTSQMDMKFSTPDRDNDQSSGNCAKEFRSGWWYRKCYYCNLNGHYFNGRTTNQYGINWFSWHKNSLQFVQMMIRPKPH